MKPSTEVLAKVCALAVEVGKRAAETPGRTEDWLNERFVSRIVSQHTANVLLDWMLGDLKLGVVVHALQHGVPLCGFSKTLPNEWPEGHKWSGVDEGNDITCPMCLAERYRALGLLPKTRGKQ